MKSPDGGSPVRRFLAPALAALSTLAFAPAAHAGILTAGVTNCAEPSFDQVFLPWSDAMHYTPAPGATAESADGWNLSGGASIAAGNEPWRVAEDNGQAHLQLPAGSSATTDTMCVGIEYPTLRFFARSSGTNLLSSLRVDVITETSLGLTATLPIGVVLPGGQWKPTLPFLVVANLLPLLPGDLTPVRFVFTPQGAGSWSVDDVFVDPYRGH